MGISTVTEAIMFLFAMLFMRYKAMVIAHEIDSAQHLLGMTNNYWETYPFKKLWTPKYQSRNELAWVESGSSLKIATANNVKAGRSRTIQALHASEIAFYDDPVTLMTGLRQTIPNKPNTFMHLESTANGIGNYFYETWQAAVANDVDFIPLFFPWQNFPDYRASAIGLPYHELHQLDPEEKILRKLGISDDCLAWRRWAIRNLCNNDIKQFHQEYPTCVVAGERVSTSRGLIPIETITRGDTTPYGDVVGVYVQPEVRCVRVTTRSGLHLDCTWHHPLVLESGLLVTASESLGSTLQLAEITFATSPPLSSWTTGIMETSITWTDLLALFAGYFMGDGYFSDGAISVVCDGKDHDVIDEVIDCIANLGITPSTRTVGSKGGGTEVRGNAKWMKDAMLNLGLVKIRESDGKYVRHVQVPGIVWRSTEHQVRLFLGGLFEADGFSNKKQWDVRLFTKWERFAKDVQVLLLGFNIHASVYKEQTGWVVKLGADQALAFHDKIGFRSARKTANRPPHKPQSMRGNRLEVVEIQELGNLPSYDLSIRDRPFFGVNGILTHNTPEEAFIATGTNVFPVAKLSACYEHMEGQVGRLTRDGDRVRFQPDPEGPLRIFRYPSKDEDWGQYFVAGDPTHTTRGDYACAQVISRRTLEQVAVYRHRIDPGSFAEELGKLGKYYNTAIVTTEKEGPGYMTIGRLIEMDYPRLWYNRVADTTPGKTTDHMGWSTTAKSKELAIGWLLKVVVDKDVLLHDRQTYMEMRDYVTLPNGGYGNAGNENHDDTVMSMAICITCHSMEGPLMPYEGQGGSKPKETPWEDWKTMEETG